MGHKNKIRSELDSMAAQSSSKGLQNMTSNSASGHTTRPFRQFSTKSRAKSTASFKGLHRITPHDSGSDADSHHSGESVFRKSGSSDSLYRKRAISGLNMTALTRVKSNPSQMPGSRSSSVNSSTSYSLGAVSTGLKPSTSKPTHSVVGLHGDDKDIDNDTTTDEEVEYFSDEEENENGKSQKSSPIGENMPRENSNNKVKRTPEENKMLSKSFSELTLPYERAENEAPHLVNQPSYKAPSSLINPQQEQLLSNSYKEVNDGNNDTNTENNDGGNAKPESNELKRQESDETANDKILHDDGDDRIDNNNLYPAAVDTSMEAGAHSLKRQGKNFQDPQENGLSLMGEDESPRGTGNYISQRRNSDHEQYIPSMILSQSTGVERRFDQPASIQNSLANNYQVMPPLEEAQNGAIKEYNMGLNKENQIIDSPSFQNVNRDQLLQQQQHQQQEEQHQQPQPPQPPPLQQQPSQRQPHFQHFHQPQLQQHSQVPPQQYQQPQQHHLSRQKQANNTNSNTQHSFSTSISSLTSSLQKMAPENVYNTSRKSHLLRKKPSQISFLGSSFRGSNAEVPNSYLHRESPPASSDINNFAQFLKSDNMDGESRTQRKLWLQRENSILDLSSQHEASDSIFMASNIEVKREFERISHEYTNVRRFSNPIEEALARVDSEQKHTVIKSTTSQDSEMLDSLIPRPINEGKEIDELLPKSQSAKLHKVLQSIWREESALFNKDTNPVNRNKSPISGHVTNTSRTSLKNVMNPGSALQHQRVINSLQPTTRAVNRRMENALHNQQRL
ncbi:ZYRO0G03542p [Zygosaccharomyces rouxii]|uniref:ZYRO0G03542p n=1 Tax=Zygosaccharomyces rouxii (strain ATCC 2623 / CBS 732 / NBRC 1130 / NCYC 568 / NRRL Y-229) TaxID=559307 RepID=C5DZD8_ZYGRC|nr:uncharacterized protein ZYRO0G03542g [Zygosaccharomyces rouxii]KAH9202221.1 TORC1 complex, subunit TCO89 [Zygosaccharomyces rouxii]CAR29222.1 ZYRO0G03542p [Zygosaccharomyces rouxii]